jgi:hypothetical protein
LCASSNCSGGSKAFTVLKRASKKARSQNSKLPEKWTMRLIQYQRRDPSQRLLTSMTDAKQFPVDEIVALYHQRWELELGWDEIKTEMLPSITRTNASVASASALEPSSVSRNVGTSVLTWPPSLSTAPG